MGVIVEPLSAASSHALGLPGRRGARESRTKTVALTPAFAVHLLLRVVSSPMWIGPGSDNGSHWTRSCDCVPGALQRLRDDCGEAVFQLHTFRFSAAVRQPSLLAGCAQSSVVCCIIGPLLRHGAEVEKVTRRDAPSGRVGGSTAHAKSEGGAANRSAGILDSRCAVTQSTPLPWSST